MVSRCCASWHNYTAHGVVLKKSEFRLCPRFSRDRVEAPKAQCAFHRDTLANEVGAGAGSAVVDVRVVMQNDIQQ
jgi:hypothetical protein